MVAAARERAGERTYRTLSPILDERTRARLDALLIPDLAGAPGRTRHSWLKEGATTNTPRAIIAQLEKLSYLRSQGADRLDLSSLNPNRLKFLASLGRRHANQALRRLAPDRRYPILLAFVAEAHADVTDEVLDLFDRLLAQADSRSRRELDEFRKGASRAVAEKVRLFREIGVVLLNPTVDDSDLRAALLERVGSAERLREAVEDSEKLVRPLDDNYYGFFAAHHARLRRFSPAFLAAFSFRATRQGEPLLDAVSLLKELKAGITRSGASRLRGRSTPRTPRRTIGWCPRTLLEAEAEDERTHYPSRAGRFFGGDPRRGVRPGRIVGESRARGDDRDDRHGRDGQRHRC